MIEKLKKFKNALIILVILCAACVNQDGLSNEILDCENNGTNVLADFNDPTSPENPAFLAEYNDNLDSRQRVRAKHDKIFHYADYADEVGEIACNNSDGLVLTGVGNQIRVIVVAELEESE